MASVKFVIRKANPWHKGGFLGAAQPAEDIAPGRYVIHYMAGGVRKIDGIDVIADGDFVDGEIEIPWSDMIKYCKVEDLA